MGQRSKLAVLVPVDVSSEERPDPALLELLRPARVVLAGWYPVPDQAAPEQLRDEHEATAIERIERIAAEFEPEDTDVETVVVFTADRETTVDRLVEEKDCGVVLLSEPVQRVERALVPIRADVNLEAILEVVGTLLEESDVSVTLFHAAESEEDLESAEMLLRGAHTFLVDAGVDTHRIETVNRETETPVEDIVDAAANHDVLLLGETEPSLIEHVIGDVPSQIIDRSERPVLIVRKPDSSGEDSSE